MQCQHIGRTKNSPAIIKITGYTAGQLTNGVKLLRVMKMLLGFSKFATSRNVNTYPTVFQPDHGSLPIALPVAAHCLLRLT